MLERYFLTNGTPQGNIAYLQFVSVPFPFLSLVSVVLLLPTHFLMTFHCPLLYCINPRTVETKDTSMSSSDCLVVLFCPLELTLRDQEKHYPIQSLK